MIEILTILIYPGNGTRMSLRMDAKEQRQKTRTRTGTAYTC